MKLTKKITLSQSNNRLNRLIFEYNSKDLDEFTLTRDYYRKFDMINMNAKELNKLYDVVKDALDLIDKEKAQ